MIPASSADALRAIARKLVCPGVDVAAGCGRLVGEDLLRQHLAEHRVHPAHRVADAHAAEGVAVVAAAHGQHPGPLGVPEAALVLQHHLQRDLDAHRAGVGEEDVLEPVRCQRDQPLSQPDRGGVGEAAEHHVRHVVELAAYGGVELRHGVPVDRRPPRRHPVDELGAAAIGSSEPQPYAGRGLDQPHRRRLGHRRVGVPDVLAVVREQLVGGAVRHSGRRRCPRRGGAWPGRASPRRARPALGVG